jgi:hypothetical protein
MKRALLRIIAISLALTLVFAFAGCIPDTHVEHQKHHAIRASAAQRHAGSPVIVVLTRVEVRTRPCDAGTSFESTPFSTGTARRLQLLDVLRV